jgi:catechol 2,3-dioxygenase-like lactoylglutathione lyase family enzyme
VLVVRDLEASLRFYRDGLGLDLLVDRQVEGDWPDLLDAPGRRPRPRGPVSSCCRSSSTSRPR